MTPPAITTAKQIANDHRALGALVLTFGDAQYASASYGMTRRHCDAMKSVSEQIHALIRDGVIVVPEALWGKRS
jgi:hypothetical protein